MITAKIRLDVHLVGIGISFETRFDGCLYISIGLEIIFMGSYLESSDLVYYAVELLELILLSILFVLLTDLVQNVL